MLLSTPADHLCELFLVLDSFRTGFAGFVDSLAPLTAVAEEGPFLKSADVYYRPDTDVALLAIRLDHRSTTPQKLSWLKSMAVAAALPLLDPEKLDPGDRKAFYREYLPTYRIRVEASDGPSDALVELARLLDIPGSKQLEDPKKSGSSPAQRTHTPTRASGTEPTGRSPEARTVLNQTVSSHRPDPLAQMSLARGVRRPGSRPPRSMTVPSTPRAKVLPRRSARATGVSESSDTAAVNVRFRRGDAWVPARLRSLTQHGARLATLAPPRPGDRVQIVLGLQRIGAVIRGEVTKVVTAATAAKTGETTGFDLHFFDLSPEQKSQLVALLRLAVRCGVSLAPPPPRASVRFPVRWPTRIFTPYGELSAPALDLSRSGLFLAPDSPLPAIPIKFTIPLDCSGPSLSGVAKVARSVSRDMAEKRGLEEGYGLRITELEAGDEVRYDKFLDRIRMRTEKRVVVAASSERAAELTSGLSAAGYTVERIDDIRPLLDRLDSAERPPDATLIHVATLESDPLAAVLKRACRARVVPCLTVAEEAAERSRTVLDHLLRIS